MNQKIDDLTIQLTQTQNYARQVTEEKINAFNDLENAYADLSEYSELAPEYTLHS